MSSNVSMVDGHDDMFPTVVSETSDLISRSALGIGLCNPDAFPEENRGYADGWNSAIAIINEAPTVDAVEVVRCKDCKWFGPNNEDSWFGCAIDTRFEEDRPKGNDFCSYGERRDGE